MSEPSSFFLRVSIEKTQYLKFMQARPSQPLVNNNWREWWDSRKMNGTVNLNNEIRAWDNASNQNIVDGWLKSEDTLTFSEFDETTNTWEFGIIMCSENYSEILPLLVFCESIFQYKKFSSQDFAVIYPYFWGDSNCMAYMTFTQNGTVLSLAQSVIDVAKDHLDYSVLRLGEKWKEFQVKMDYD